MKTDIDHLMQERKLDAIFVSGSTRDNPAMYYLTNGAKIGEYSLLVKKTNEDAILIVIGMERDEASASGLQIIERSHFNLSQLLQQESGNKLVAHARMLESIFQELEIDGRIGVYGREEQGFTLALFQELESRLPNLTFVGESTPNLLQTAQITKDVQEMARIRNLSKRALNVVSETRNYISTHTVNDGQIVTKKGTPLTIGDVRSRILRWSVEHNLENPEGLIFATGRDAAIPHSRGQDVKPLRVGETIVFDYFPCEYGGGYFYDFTRTWCIGHASPRIEQLYKEVITAYDMSLSNLHVGQHCSTSQKLVNDYLENQGHNTTRSHPGTNSGYVHTLGHGIGLSVHEHPRLSETASDNDIIQAGMALTIEPGLYYPEYNIGIRVENYVWLNPATGYPEHIGTFDRELVIPI
ncbi:MAG: hypothetical protein CL606_06920 [Anaerolineaceae bacterium]|nr:hypothetical protein [Anaerolineaceae bacterium]|tara:strand:- start:1194 stop:2426 length:1233 start_codon:yes stop_codon:yes gene_type:complete